MIRSRNRLYLLFFTACLAGYSWLGFTLLADSTTHRDVELCLIKRLTNIPCPACGSTRAVVSLTKGNFAEALYTNPLGFVVAAIMLLLPLWIGLDLFRRSSSLVDFYKKIESLLQKPMVAIPLIGLVLINWIWNITKGL